jgi:hypothetical protein
VSNSRDLSGARGAQQRHGLVDFVVAEFQLLVAQHVASPLGHEREGQSAQRGEIDRRRAP